MVILLVAQMIVSSSAPSLSPEEAVRVLRSSHSIVDRTGAKGFDKTESSTEVIAHDRWWPFDGPPPKPPSYYDPPWSVTTPFPYPRYDIVLQDQGDPNGNLSRRNLGAIRNSGPHTQGSIRIQQHGGPEQHIATGQPHGGGVRETLRRDRQ